MGAALPTAQKMKFSINDFFIFCAVVFISFYLVSSLLVFIRRRIAESPSESKVCAKKCKDLVVADNLLDVGFYLIISRCFRKQRLTSSLQ